MTSAFGVEHVGKRLPSALRGAPVGKLKPLGHIQARQAANAQGRHASKANAVWRSAKDNRQQGHSTLNWVRGQAIQEGRNLKESGRLVPQVQRKQRLP
jgi:hypothetical protein